MSQTRNSYSAPRCEVLDLRLGRNRGTCAQRRVAPQPPVLLGPAWRLPTKAECEELANTSRFEWLWQDSSYAMMGGKLVTSNDTGLSLFLPAAGRCHTRLMGRNQTGHYWTTTLGTTPTHANHLSLSNTEQHVRHDYRYEGYTIRPVLSAGVNPILSGFDTEITF